MTDCAHCGETLSVDEPWRLRPEIEPRTLDTDSDYAATETYMHPVCRDTYREAMLDA